ncbi:hypothetical protein BN946_scf184943.g57 [Trametes cinnabarina]|uniref:Uncharacterized protein n=1 Tax=Pycnoporus cinnabarinus TaxID=5643 RepID=A0A060SBY3_PYCCI|nr:hypothetical protein BN946_scf184943.g57 [Trametes cinnabarina]
MPACGHATAPTFDPEQPRTLRRFFQDLETFFERSGVEADCQKKEWVVRYLPIDVAELCQSLPDYYADDKSYEDFRQAIIALYPGASDEQKYSIADVENLIVRRAKSPIANISELSAYDREFFVMTSYLIHQGRLSAVEQSCLFVRGIAPPLWEQISCRLQLKLPDHYPDDPYTLEQVYNAAKFVLHGTLSSTSSSSQSANTSSGGLVKTEEIAPILRYLVQAIAEQPGNRGYGGNGFAGPRYQMNAPPPPSPRFPNAPYPQQEAHPANNNNNFCHYCGNIHCCLRTCPFVEEDTRAGRCHRNMDGRVILPNGSYVLRSLPNFDGVTMRNRIFEWNRQNTNTMAPPDQQNVPAAGQPGNQAAQLFFAVAPEMPPAVANFHLTTDERINQLERELFALRAGRQCFDGIEVPQCWRSFSRNGPLTNGEHDLPPHIAQHPPTPRRGPEQSESAAYPEHPFAKARDATYAPPKARNFRAAPAKTKESDRDPAYRTQAPVHNPKVAEGIFACSMKAPVISLSPEELLSIAPEVREKYCEAVAPKRVPATKTVAFVQFTEEIGEDRKDADDVKPFLLTVTCNGEALEPGGYVLPDPYEVYLHDVAPKNDPKSLVVAKESHALRSIVGLMANKEYVEGVVDPGCMVIAMSEEACHALGLWYDPSVTLRMVSANGEVNSSLGLVRNIPFKVADIVLYLQVHVIRNAAYDLLLGRPFDVLMKSVVKNFNNEDQTITISCPNMGQVATIPTIKRTSGDVNEVAVVISEENGVPKFCAYTQVLDPDVPVPALYLSACDSLPAITEAFLQAKTPQSGSVSSAKSTSAKSPSRSHFQPSYPSPRPVPPRTAKRRNSRNNGNAKANAAQPDRTDTFTFAEQPRPVFTFSYETEEGSYTVTPCGEREPASILLTTKKKYKPVAKKVRASLENCPEKFCIEQNITGDPLPTMPKLNPNPPEFSSTGLYTAERKEAMDRAHGGDFLWPEERKLLHDFMCKHNDGFAWSDSKRGCFKPEFFPPIKFPVLPHTPWVEKNIPIPPGLYKEVCKILKKKIAAGVYELSNSLYRSRWFCVLKKDGKSLRIVHSLEPLNKVTIQHSGVPPTPDYLAEQFAGRPCGAIFDLYVGYDE